MQGQGQGDEWKGEGCRGKEERIGRKRKAGEEDDGEGDESGILRGGFWEDFG
jgi:hypothetical protein